MARVKGSIVAGGLRLVLIGAVVGVAGSLLLLRTLGALLFGVTPYDVLTYAIVIASLGIGRHEPGAPCLHRRNE